MRVSPQEQAFAAAALVEGLQADAPIGFAVHDDELRFELVSHSLAAIYGRPPEEHIGRRVTQILPGGPAGEIETLLAQVRDTGVAQTGVELDATTAAAPREVRTWVATLYPLEIDQRRRVGVVLVDVTERRRAQHALQESERLLSGAQRMAGLGWWRWTARPESVVYAPELLAMLGHDPSAAAAGLRLAEPQEIRRLRSEARAALAEQRPLASRARTRRTDGELRTFDLRADLVQDEDGEPIGLQGFIQDITELEQAAERQRLVAELGQAALAGASLQEVMDQAAAAVEAGLPVDGAAVMEFAPDGEELVFRAMRAAAGLDVPERLELAPDGLAAHLLESRQPVVVGDWERDNPFPSTDTAALIGARSVAVAVIGGRGNAFGVMAAIALQPDRFGPEAATFLQAIANMVADAVERQLAEAEIAELSAARGRLVAQALDAEARARRRISDTLHDGTLQDLLAARNDLYALGDADDVQEVREALSTVVRRLREIMSALHPTVLQYGGLEAAVAAVAEQQAHAGGFTAQVSVDPDAAGAHDELLLSVARELLSNVARHAGARHASVSLRGEEDSVVLEVADDGAGLAPGRPDEARAEGRIGLASCHERMAAIGGALRVEGTPGRGTLARAEAPSRSGRTGRISSLERRADGA